MIKQIPDMPERVFDLFDVNMMGDVFE